MFINTKPYIVSNNLNFAELNNHSLETNQDFTTLDNYFESRDYLIKSITSTQIIQTIIITPTITNYIKRSLFDSNQYSLAKTEQSITIISKDIPTTLIKILKAYIVKVNYLEIISPPYSLADNYCVII